MSAQNPGTDVYRVGKVVNACEHSLANFAEAVHE